MAEDFSDEESDIALNNKVFNKLQSDMKLDGYRAGLSAGQEENVQKGFSIGYRRALAESMKLSKFRGMFTAILCHNMLFEKESRSTQAEKSEPVVKGKVIDGAKVLEVESMIEQLSQAEKSLAITLSENKSMQTVSKDAVSSSSECSAEENSAGNRDVKSKDCSISGEGDDVHKKENVEQRELLAKANALLESLGHKS